MHTDLSSSYVGIISAPLASQHRYTYVTTIIMYPQPNPSDPYATQPERKNLSTPPLSLNSPITSPYQKKGGALYY
jgi:hypothetical protein